MARRSSSGFFLSARDSLQGRGSQTRSRRWIRQLRNSKLGAWEDTQAPNTIHRFSSFKNHGSGEAKLRMATQWHRPLLPQSVPS